MKSTTENPNSDLDNANNILSLDSVDSGRRSPRLIVNSGSSEVPTSIEDNEQLLVGEVSMDNLLINNDSKNSSNFDRLDSSVNSDMSEPINPHYRLIEEQYGQGEVERSQAYSLKLTDELYNDATEVQDVNEGDMRSQAYNVQTEENRIKP